MSDRVARGPDAGASGPTLDVTLYEGTVATGGHFTPTTKEPEAAILLRRLLDLDMPEDEVTPRSSFVPKSRVRLGYADDAERGSSDGEYARPTLDELRAALSRPSTGKPPADTTEGTK